MLFSFYRDLSVENLSYLSSEQALADIAYFITCIRDTDQVHVVFKTYRYILYYLKDKPSSTITQTLLLVEMGSLYDQFSRTPPYFLSFGPRCPCKESNALWTFMDILLLLLVENFRSGPHNSWGFMIRIPKM